MHKTYASIAALTVAILSPSAASAADIFKDNNPGGYAQPYSAPAPSWSGVWVGAAGGYQFTKDELSKSFDDDPTEFIDGLGSEGLFGEAQIGYDHQIGNNVLVGIFAGYNINDAEFSTNALGGDTLNYSQDWGGVVGARLGWIKGNTTFYGAGGYAFGELNKISFDGIDVYPDQETDLHGWFAELGAEHRVEGTRNVYAFIAGRYTDYGNVDLGDGISCAFEDDLKLDRNDLTAMAGIKVKLGFGN